MLRHEGSSTPDNLRILRTHGASVELPVDSYRLIVDVLCRWPATGEPAERLDGFGLVAKRIEAVSGSEPAELRLISANPVYEPYAVPAQDVHMVGNVA